MKKIIIILPILLISLPAFIMAQPVITLCENFSIGTVLKFQQCNTANVYAGSGGASQTWNFTSLLALPDTMTETMVPPAATSYANTFPGANLIEKYSDGTFVFVNLTTDSNYLTGYADSINGYFMRYPNSILFAVRPITYGDIITDTFTAIFNSSTYNYTGKGTSSIQADGYGTLMLPMGTYTDVLRLKITQTQSDTASSSGIVSDATTVSYVWFDNAHTSALMKIDSSQYSGYITKSVEYLISESPTGIKAVNTFKDFSLYPNPASGTLNIAAPQSGMLTFSNTLGEVVKLFTITETQTILSTNFLNPGFYYVMFQSAGYKKTLKLVIE